MKLRYNQLVSGTQAALIDALEPMWTALFGHVLACDKLSFLALIGRGFILTEMIVGSVGKIHLSREKTQ